MINRRGMPEEIISNNGTNFVAVEKEVNKSKILNLLQQ